MVDNALVKQAFTQILDGNGDPYAGAKLYIFDAGTTNQRTTYSDNDLTTPNTHPVVADGEGRFGGIYIGVDTPNDYKFSLETADDVVIQTADNITGPLDTSGFLTGTVSPSRAVISKTSNYTVVAADDGKQINANPSGGNFTITLRSAVALGDGGDILIHNSGTAGTVTVSAAGGETIDGDTSRFLEVGDSGVYRSDGANYFIGEDASFTSGRVDVAFDTAIDLDVSPYPSGTNFFITATNDFTFTTSGDRRGHWYTVVIRQDATGGHTPTLNAKLVGYFAPDLRPFAITRFDIFARSLASQDVAQHTPLVTGVPDVVAENQQAQNTGGGSTTVSASYQNTPLNTLVRNNGSIASLSSDQITLGIGTYYAEWSVPILGANSYTSALYDVTADNVIKEGTSEVAASGSTIQSRSFGSAVFSLTVATAIAVRYKVAVALATNGHGNPTNLSAEVYGQLKIWRI